MRELLNFGRVIFQLSFASSLAVWNQVRLPEEQLQVGYFWGDGGVEHSKAESSQCLANIYYLYTSYIHIYYTYACVHIHYIYGKRNMVYLYVYIITHVSSSDWNMDEPTLKTVSAFESRYFLWETWDFLAKYVVSLPDQAFWATVERILSLLHNMGLLLENHRFRGSPGHQIVWGLQERNHELNSAVAQMTWRLLKM